MRSRRRAALVGALVVATVVLGACGGSDGSSTRPVCADCKTYDESDRDISTTSGEQFVIELESNVTTGYAWDVQSNSDPGVARNTGTQYIDADDGRDGSGGVQRLVFVTDDPGTATIVLRYERPFEADDPSDQELTYTVNVT